MPKSPPPPTIHITDADSGSFGATPPPFPATGPGALLMDADAWLISSASTIVLDGQWTATINGTVVSSNFSGGGNAAVDLETDSTSLHSSLTFGAGAEIDGFSWGVLAAHPTDITNKGSIDSDGSSGIGISEMREGSYTINNSGTITAGETAIDLTNEGSGGPGGPQIHMVVNSGTITAPTAIDDLETLKLSNTGTINGDVGMFAGTITNSGVINGDVTLGDSNDTFTDFGTVKVGGKTVTHQGTVTGTITFDGAQSHFNGGNNAETVEGLFGGESTYKLAGGDDTLIVNPDGIGGGTSHADGGAGRDTYDFSGLDASFTVNLDTKAHGSAGANTANFNGSGLSVDKITNFEDVKGGGGDDTIYGNASANHLFGGDGSDTLFGLAGNDVLMGQFGGGDMLIGGAGRDIMTGGDNDSGSGGELANDTFVYTALSDSGITASTRDEITDFDNGDIIDLSAIDAIPKTAAHDEFHFIGESKWDGEAGALRYVWTETQTIVEADVNGDKKMDFSIALDGHHTLTADDFLGVF